MECLLKLLREQPLPAAAAESEWLDVLTICEQENILPWLASRLTSLSDQLPQSISAELAEIRRQARQEAFAWTAELKQMLAAFHQRGIPVISLKGPWLAERLYGDASLRCYGDLDFLVRPSDWNAVEDTLRELGFAPVGPSDDRHREWERGGVHVEPHFRLQNPVDFDWDTEAVWRRAVLSEFHGVPGWLLAPVDELRFLSIHAVLHGFGSFKLLLDVNLAFQKLSLPDDFVNEPGDSVLQNSVALCWVLAAPFGTNPSLPGLSPDFIASRPYLQMTADRIWEHLTLGPSSPSWRTVRRMFVDMEAPGWPRFRRRMRYGLAAAHIALTCLDEADFVFAARFHLRRSWQVRMLRPIRLLTREAHAALQRASKIAHFPNPHVQSKLIPFAKGTDS